MPSMLSADVSLVGPWLSFLAALLTPECVPDNWRCDEIDGLRTSTEAGAQYASAFILMVLAFVKIWLARTLIVVLVFAAMPPERAASSTLLAPLPSTVRVNISLLGTSYA
jgi:hypothetical protein